MPEWFPLNWNLMKYPTNWVIVTLMVLIGGIALHLLVSLAPESTVTLNKDFS